MRQRSLRKKNPATFSVVPLEIALEVAKKFDISSQPRMPLQIPLQKDFNDFC